MMNIYIIYLFFPGGAFRLHKISEQNAHKTKMEELTAETQNGFHNLTADTKKKSRYNIQSKAN